MRNTSHSHGLYTIYIYTCTLYITLALPLFLEINAILDVYIESVSCTLAILKCELPCFSPGLECALFNIAKNNTYAASATVTTTSVVGARGSDASCNHQAQLIMLTNLTSDTTYSYCVVAINTTDMMKVGDQVCGNFATDTTASTNKMEKGTDGRHIHKYVYAHIVTE